MRCNLSRIPWLTTKVPEQGRHRTDEYGWAKVEFLRLTACLMRQTGDKSVSSCCEKRPTSSSAASLSWVERPMPLVLHMASNNSCHAMVGLRLVFAPKRGLCWPNYGQTLLQQAVQFSRMHTELELYSAATAQRRKRLRRLANSSFLFLCIGFRNRS
jgi:hypothetical protein